MQALAEILYDFADKGLTGPMIGDRGRPFLPFVFTLFSLDRGVQHRRSVPRPVHSHLATGGHRHAWL